VNKSKIGSKIKVAVNKIGDKIQTAAKNVKLRSSKKPNNVNTGGVIKPVIKKPKTKIRFSVKFAIKTASGLISALKVTHAEKPVLNIAQK